jgi:glycogen debranching enzyme
MPLETLVDGYSFFVRTTPDELGPQGGLYHRDTRYLSELAVDVAGMELTHIGETLDAPNERTVTLATAGPAVNEISDRNVPKHSEVVVQRRQSVREAEGYAETVVLQNHAATPRSVTLTVEFDADFADLFEVRGLGTDIDRDVRRTVDDRSVVLRYDYETADGESVTRATRLRFGRRPERLSETAAVFSARVSPQGRFELPFVAVVDGGTSASESESTPSAAPDWSDGAAATLPTRTDPVSLPPVETGTDRYDAVFERARTDLVALTTETEHGPVPLAGTPWFVTPFGRDALLTAHQTLAVAPSLAAGTLRYFAANRGREDVPSRGEEPGKVFHEVRHGELADRRRVPHRPYFGTVDATPLWVTLLDETCRWRGSEALAEELADALADALAWTYRTSDAGADDPFLYYETDGVLDHHAWKDTADSVRFADGTVADGPLAVAEVQGYAARALDRGTALLDGLDADVETHLPTDAYRDRAREIERAFDEEFWLPHRTYYGLAKDGDGRIVDAVTSNVGHCLWTETVPDDRAGDVVETLVDGPSSTGWGLRTMSPTDAGYSPVSYHAGGVWPHDTSLVALGLSRYGRGDAAERLARNVLDAATRFEHERLPELYCGFDADRDPVEYPAACTPQAWAAGAPFAFLQAAFDLAPGDDGPTARRAPDLFAAETVETLGGRTDWSPRSE